MFRLETVPTTAIIVIVVLFNHIKLGSSVNHKLDDGPLDDLGSFSFVVYLTTNGTKTCTGSLIHKLWVLTAAHCFGDIPNPYATEHVKMYAGTVDVHAAANVTSDNATVQVRISSLIMRYEKLGTPYRLDVALVMANRPFDLTLTVSRVRLALPPFPTNQRRCYVLGYGMISARRSAKKRVADRHKTLLHVYAATVGDYQYCKLLESGGNWSHQSICMVLNTKICGVGVTFGGPVVCMGTMVGILSKQLMLAVGVNAHDPKEGVTYLPKPDLEDLDRTTMSPNPEGFRDVTSILPKPNMDDWDVTSMLPKPNMEDWDVTSMLPKPNMEDWDVTPMLPKPNMDEWDVTSMLPKPNMDEWDVTSRLTTPYVVKWDVKRAKLPKPIFDKNENLLESPDGYNEIRRRRSAGIVRKLSRRLGLKRPKGRDKVHFLDQEESPPRRKRWGRWSKFRVNSTKLKAGDDVDDDYGDDDDSGGSSKARIRLGECVGSTYHVAMFTGYFLKWVTKHVEVLPHPNKLQPSNSRQAVRMFSDLDDPIADSVYVVSGCLRRNCCLSDNVLGLVTLILICRLLVH